jgi:hypothetical protein
MGSARENFGLESLIRNLFRYRVFDSPTAEDAEIVHTRGRQRPEPCRSSTST